jgi:ribosomal protein S27AE
MTYVCELGTKQTVYLDNRGDLTIVTTSSVGIGQQQQSSSSFATGQWTASPEVYQTPHGAILKLSTTQGQHYIEIQENSHCLLPNYQNNKNYYPLPLRQVAAIPPPPSMQPMQPMQPMKMGNMQMGMNPMEMRMGNMVLQMNSTVNPEKQATERQFCSHCGAKIKPEDRFCSSCGHGLGD